MHIYYINFGGKQIETEESRQLLVPYNKNRSPTHPVLIVLLF